MMVTRKILTALVSIIAMASTAGAWEDCGWTSPAQIVGQIEAEKLNVIDLVVKCADICQVAFNSSSVASELAGEGVMISYYIQVALICLFAGLLPVVIWLFNVFSWKAGIRTTPLLRTLRKSVYEINAFFSISLSVASLVRWSQDPPVMETVFISYMVWNQISNTVFMLYGQLHDQLLNKAPLIWDWNLYYAAIGLAHLVASCVIVLPNRATYKDLATQCRIQQQFPDIAKLIPASALGTSTLKCILIGLSISLGLVILARLFGKALLNFIPAWNRRQGGRTFNTFNSGFLLISIVTIIALAQIFAEMRGVLKTLSGDQLPENGWGYGEITAILLWVPLLWSLLKETMKHMRVTHPTQQAGTQTQAGGGITAFTIEIAPDAGPPLYASEKGEATLRV